jgi:uncharacterized membrane protein YvlD (DUF360 family)
MGTSSQFIIETLLFGLAVLLSAYLYPAVKVKSFLGALGLALVLMLTSAFVVLFLQNAGIGLGALELLLASLIAYALAIWLMARFNKGLLRGGFGSALIFAIVLVLLRWGIMWLYSIVF